MSKFTLADLIAKSQSYLYPPIVSPKTLNKINKFSNLLPPTSAVGLEWRLAEDNTEVDYFIRADHRDEGDKILAGCNPEKTLAISLSNDPIWQRIQQFCQIWIQENSPLNKYVDIIWLEMDNQELDKAAPAPCFFFELLRQATQDPDWITDIALKNLYGNPVALSTKDAIAKCIDHLPEFASLVYIGAMLSRSASPIRLCVKLLWQDVIPYLQAIGWNHNTEEVEQVLHTFVKDFAEKVVLTIDVQDRVMPRIGFEIKPAFRAKGWDVILEKLVINELCYASQRDALLNWQGQPEALQDKEFRRQLSLMPPENLSDDNLPLIVRKLNHVKIDYYPEELVADLNIEGQTNLYSKLKAKMYLAIIYLYHQQNCLS